MMDRILTGLFDELEKIAVSCKTSTFMQTRKGRRPIRAQTLLDNENNNRLDDFPPGTVASAFEHEAGQGLAEKVAEERKRDKVIGAFAKARPYTVAALKAGLPAALFGKIMFEGTKAAPHAARTLAIGGAAAGVVNEALKDWAKRHKRRLAAKEVLEKTSTIRKAAAMAADLRRLGIGGVKRPPFPTEGSKQFAFNQLKNAQNASKFSTQTQFKHLVKPGASIRQIAPVPKL